MATNNIGAEKQAYAKFRQAGMTSAGACGLIGNLEAESDGFYPNRVEYLCLQRLREHGKTYTDKTYTKAIDDGKLSCEEFLHPLPDKQYGYGLAQWTSPGRKAGLWNLAREMNVSIADEDMQLSYLLKELEENYPSVLKILKKTSSIREASDIVLKKFECPANTGESVCAGRAARGQRFYDTYVKEVEKVSTSQAIQKVIDIATAEIGYLEKRSASQMDSKTANAGSANYTKYWRDVYPNYQAQAWCACFVSWVFMQAFGKDMAQKLLKHWPFVYCPTLAGMTSNKNPHKGDIVLFYRNGVFAHTGIVTAVNGEIITTIEGNTSGASGIIANGGGVCQKTYNLDGLCGSRFFRPDYSIVTPEPMEIKPGMVLRATQRIPLRSGLSTAQKKAGYIKYKSLKSTIAKNKCRRTLKGNAVMKKDRKFAVQEVKTDWKGNTWVRIKIAGAWLPVCVKGVWRVAEA